MNPQKQSKKIDLKFTHRLIIVVFIPSLQGYYKDVLEVFKLSLESAIDTTNDSCAITVVNNASCDEVGHYLQEKLSENTIDTLIHHKENIGKIDALIGAARGTREPIVTISDVDILFDQNWQQDVEHIFVNLKNVASVSPIPCRNFYNYETTSTYLNILKKSVSFKPQPIPENHDAQNRYLASFNWEQEKDKNVLWPVIEGNGVKANMGSGHQILSMRRELFFKTVPLEPSLTLVGNHSEEIYCDRPINYSGGMRLATYYNRAYHMGNKVEPWMKKIYETNKEMNLADKSPKIQRKFHAFKPDHPNQLIFRVKAKFINYLFNLIYKYSI